MLEALLVWETGIVVMATYATMTFVKSALALYAPAFREEKWVKRLGLPMLSAFVGGAVAQFIHPQVVDGLANVTAYGLVCGYFATALFRHLTSLVPALKAVDDKLSLRPTIPAPPNVVSDSVSQAEQRLP